MRDLLKSNKAVLWMCIGSIPSRYEGQPELQQRTLKVKLGGGFSLLV